MKRRLIQAILMTLMWVMDARSATFTAATSGNWTNPATWGGAVPGPADTVNIRNYYAVTLDSVSGAGSIALGVNGASAGYLTINGPGALTQGNIYVTMDFGSTLAITNGGAWSNGMANSPFLYVGNGSGSAGNTVLVSGPGSALVGAFVNQSFAVGWGSNSFGNRLVVGNGAALTYMTGGNMSMGIGMGVDSYSNAVVFDDATFAGAFTYANRIGGGAGAHDNLLAFTNGAVAYGDPTLTNSLVVPYLVGAGASSFNNGLIVAGTNASGQKATIGFGFGNATTNTLAIGFGAGAYSNYLWVGAGGQAIGYASGSPSRGDLIVGAAPGAYGNYAVVSNGGAVYIRGSDYLRVGTTPGGTAYALTNNYLVIDGDGSLVSVTNGCAVLVGASSNAAGNYILLRGGGVLESTNFVVGLDNTTTGNVITNNGGVLQFMNATPAIAISNAPANGIVMDGGTLSFSGLTNATDLLNRNRGGTYEGQFTWRGTNKFRLNNAALTCTTGYTFQATGDPLNYAGLELVGGTTLIGAGPVTIGAAGSVLFSNTTATVSGTFTNRGTMTVANSTVTFVSDLALVAGCTINFTSTNILPVTVNGILSAGGGTVNLPGGLDRQNSLTLFVSSNLISGFAGLTVRSPNLWDYQARVGDDLKSVIAVPFNKGTVIMIR